MMFEMLAIVFSALTLFGVVAIKELLLRKQDSTPPMSKEEILQRRANYLEQENNKLKVENQNLKNKTGYRG